MSSRGVRLPVETDRVVRVGRAHVIVIHMLRLGKREWGRLIEASEHMRTHFTGWHKPKSLEREVDRGVHMPVESRANAR